MEKVRVTKEYDKLSESLKEQIKLDYPNGFSDYLISFTNKEGKKMTALRFETEDKIYLIRMTFDQAVGIVEADDDYDDEGVLHDEVKSEYEQKQADGDYDEVYVDFY